MIPDDYDKLWAELPTLMFLSTTKGKFAVIDSADAHISLHKWTECDGYAFRFGAASAKGEKRERINMHHLVLRPSPGMVIDHKNRNRMDNRRCNLREATLRQNLFNQRAYSASGFKGVYRNGNENSYYVVMRIGEKATYFGSRRSPEEAAALYDLHALKYHGDFAVLNFPSRRPEYEAQLKHESAA